MSIVYYKTIAFGWTTAILPNAAGDFFPWLDLEPSAGGWIVPGTIDPTL